jgi:hypothetical protein
MMSFRNMCRSGTIAIPSGVMVRKRQPLCTSNCHRNRSSLTLDPSKIVPYEVNYLVYVECRSANFLQGVFPQKNSAESIQAYLF